MRAVVYARFSSDLQAPASIEDQIRLCRQRIAQESWEYLHAYTDRAMSGASALRPAYQALLDDARRGEFDVATLHTPTRAPARGGRIIAKPRKCLRIGPLLHQKPGIVTSVRVLCKGRFRCGVHAARWYKQQPKGKPDRRMMRSLPSSAVGPHAPCASGAGAP